MHVPHGDLALAAQVRRLTREAGLAIAAYGSYYRADRSEAEGLSFTTVLDTAEALGATLLRVWPGPSAATLSPDRRKLALSSGNRVVVYQIRR